ncbi:hypothetical protein BC834DRAFT_284472 [Gloeopeniophorella convolvens]|nr:hypothetical protein BC834DRAFT_284472 [Gloeopeniophorella convolvens]
MAASLPPPSSDDVPRSGPPELLTYRFEGQHAYVPGATTHEEAITLAQRAFPDLADVPPKRISLHVSATTSYVAIPAVAWSSIVSKLPLYRVLDVRVHKEAEAPPGYQAASGTPTTPTLKGKTRDERPPPPADDKGIAHSRANVGTDLSRRHLGWLKNVLRRLGS